MPDNLSALLEAIVYLAEEPVKLDQIRKAIPDVPREQLKAEMDALIERYRSSEHGLEIREVADGYRFTTKPEHHEVLKKFAKSLVPPTRLSLAALETLAVIAYKQPITIPEIQEIRGVHASGVIKTLMDRKLVTAAGRKEVVGRPILYKTTRRFLMHFGLKNLDDLPSMEEFDEIIKSEHAEQAELPLEPAEPEDDLGNVPEDKLVVEIEKASESEPESVPEPEPENDPAPDSETEPGNGVEPDLPSPNSDDSHDSADSPNNDDSVDSPDSDDTKDETVN